MMNANASGQGSEATGEVRPDVGRLRRDYLDYLSSKRPELNERREARRYYHSDQWTKEEIAELKRRRQPIGTYNQVARKINGVVGVLERLKQDPKAYPRTPKHEEGADIATATLRYVMDRNHWDGVSSAVARDAAIEGLAGIELVITETNGERDVDISEVDTATFFYDPTSVKADFSDARYMGVAKWISEDLAEETFPDKKELIDSLLSTGEDGFTLDQDREAKWVDRAKKRLRLVDHWYAQGGVWRWCIYVGNDILATGETPFVDGHGKPCSKYVMFSAAVDHDGDRYGFFRSLKSAQDEINHRRSKSLHLLNSRRIIMEDGAVQDIEKLRREAVKPDGVIVKTPGFEVQFEDTKTQVDLASHLKLLEDAKAEIENFGPNPALIGNGIENKSGRAIGLLQQAGIAELGPYIIAFREWKLRVYRAVWLAIQRHWTGERWVRVTDDEGLAQFIQLNGIEVDPMTGLSQIVNAIGTLDVDIILDEGPDSINMAADAYDALTALAQQGERLPPGLLVELAPGIPQEVKRKYLKQLEQMTAPNPMQEEGARLELEGKAAQIGKTQAETVRIVAETGRAHAETQATQAQAFAPYQQPQPGNIEQGFMG